MSLDADVVPYGALGRPISGPRAVAGGWQRFWHLTFNIAFMQWKLRFFGSALGYLWQLVRPLLLFLVLYLFFTQVARIGQGKGSSYDDYGAQLLSAIVLFTFFSEATSGAVRSVIENETLVRKIQFPRMVIPLSVVLLALFNLGLNLIVVLIFALAAGVTPMLTWLELPVILAFFVLLCTGIAMLLSALFVYMRDIEPIWEVSSQILFYASPIIIPVVAVQQRVSPTLLHAYMLNPLADIIQQFRHAFITPATPSVSALLGSDVAVLIPVGIILAIFALGLWVFNRVAPRVAEDL
ncbi:MAG: ABC transporter permease [Actinomycetota bacterium]|nr:ABC transporter permease [Actinomycetota bacterium]